MRSLTMSADVSKLKTVEVGYAFPKSNQFYYSAYIII